MSSALQSYVDSVKDYMRDYADLNKLIEGEENIPSLREKAIFLALDQLNSLTPLTDYTIDTCPYRAFLVDLSVTKLLRSLLLLLERNRIQVADGGGVAAAPLQIDLIRQTIKEILFETLPSIKEAKTARALLDAVNSSGSHHSWYYGDGRW